MIKSGTGSADVIVGTESADQLSGLGADDLIYGFGGNDRIDGGSGNDSLYGGFGDDYLYDEFGVNTLFGDGGDDILYLYGGALDGKLYGGNGSDELYGAGGNDVIDGGDGDDYLSGGSGNDMLDGGTGNDLLSGGAGNDRYTIRNRYADVYDSSGVDSGLIYVDFYKPSSDIENWSWAEGVQRLPYWIDSLLPDGAPGFHGLLNGGTTVYYCFPSSVPSYFSADDCYGFSPFNAQQQAFARQALAYISSVIDLQFVETTNASGLNTIVFANNIQSSSAGYAYYPYADAIGSDLFLDGSTSGNLAPRDGEYSALTLIHELGHTLGLKHTFSHADASGDTGDGPFLPAAEESTQWSAMSYTDRPAEYHLSFSPFDIAALQYLYGPSKSVATNDTYVIRSDTTNFIWDGGGVDTIDASRISQAMYLNLEPGYWGYIGSKSSLISTAGQITLNFGTIIENVQGGVGNDVIVGNAAANQVSGGAGDDILDGGEGIDTATFAGARNNLAVTKTNAGYAIFDHVGSEGVDTLLRIETIKFSDISLTLEADSSIGQTYMGSIGSDLFEGTAGDDIMTGAGGNDRLIGRSGNDLFDGGDDIDTVVLDGKQSEFNLVRASTGISVKNLVGAQSIDTLRNIERVHFNDIALAFDVEGSPGKLYRLYQAAFDRVPDLEGLGYWINILDWGYDFYDVAYCFFRSDEFKALYGPSPSDSDLIMSLYRNVLHRAPDQEGFNYWLNSLASGLATPQQLLVQFSESAENKVQVIGSIQDGIEFKIFT